MKKAKGIVKAKTTFWILALAATVVLALIVGIFIGQKTLGGITLSGETVSQERLE